jgi:hypothetical protein
LLLQRHQSVLRELVRKLAERTHAVIALAERRIELQQRALQQAKLRRHLAIDEDLQRARDQRHRLLDRLRPRAVGALAFAAAARLPRLPGPLVPRLRPGRP